MARDDDPRNDEEHGQHKEHDADRPDQPVNVVAEQVPSQAVERGPDDAPGGISKRVVHLSYLVMLNSIHQVVNLLADLNIEPTDVIALFLPRIMGTVMSEPSASRCSNSSYFGSPSASLQNYGPTNLQNHR